MTANLELLTKYRDNPINLPRITKDALLGKRRKVGESSPRREEQLNLAQLAAKLADLQPRTNESHTQISDQVDVANAVEGELSSELSTWKRTTISFVVKNFAAATPEESLTPPEIARIESLVGDIDHQVPLPLPEWQQKIWEGLRHIFPDNPRFVTALVLAITLMATNLHEASAQSKLPTPTATIQSGENPLITATPTPEPTQPNDQLNGEDAALVSESNQEEAGQEESAITKSTLEVSPTLITYKVLTDTVPLEAPRATAKPVDGVEFKAGEELQSGSKMIVDGITYVAIKIVLPPAAGAAANAEPVVIFGWIPESKLEATDAQLVETTKTVNNAVVLVDSLNVRSGPGTDHAVVGTLNKGDQAEILEEVNGWYKVVVNGVESYISAAPQFTSKVTAEIVDLQVNPVLSQYATVESENSAVFNPESKGGQISPEELMNLARIKFGDKLVSVAVDSERGPIAFGDGNQEIGKFEGGRWRTEEEINAKRYTAAELLAEFGENEMVKEALERLPEELLVANYETNMSEKLELTSDNFTFWFIGVKLHALVNKEGHEVDLSWVDFYYRSNWQIFQFNGRNFDLYLDASFNGVHPTRESMVKGDKILLLKILPNSLQGLEKSETKLKHNVNPSSEALESYKEHGYISQSEIPIADRNISGEKLVDEMVQAFKEMIKGSDLTHDGTKYQLKNGEVIDISKPIQFRLLRYPDFDGSKSWYIPKVVFDVPEDPWIIVDGQIFFDITKHHPRAAGLGGALTLPLALFLQKEVGIVPDRLNELYDNFPIFDNLNDAVLNLLEIDGKAIVFHALLFVTSMNEDGSLVYD